jgi:membrane protein DedA with SNARE-associated domain
VSTIAILGLVLLATAVGAIVGYIIGHEYGVDFGRSSQWVDDYFDRVNAERARHGKDGKFIGRAKT